MVADRLLPHVADLLHPDLCYRVAHHPHVAMVAGMPRHELSPTLSWWRWATLHPDHVHRCPPQPPSTHADLHRVR